MPNLPASPDPSSPAVPARVTIVLPTYNEADNVLIAIDRVAAVMGAIPFEVIVVDDDSPDGTADRVKERALIDARVHCLRRVGRRGLAGACIEGMLASSAPIVAVMDADLQHDETLLPQMLQRIEEGGADLVVGSRFADGAEVTGLSPLRHLASRSTNLAIQTLLRVRLSDPLSGFFMMRRDRFDGLAPRLSTQGFKILLDIVATAHGRLKVAEIPFVFRPRHAGASKLDRLVMLDFASLFLSKLLGGFVSARFLLFGMVGASGVVVHLGTLKAGLSLFGLPFDWAQGVATFIAMTTNFFLNNALTYHDRKLKGRRLILGLLSFYLVCSVGLFANVGVAGWLYSYDHIWWLAGTAGAVVGSVWNYAASSVLTWRRK